MPICANVCTLLTILLLVVRSAPGADDAISVPAAELGRGYQLIGKLHEALGKVVRVQGHVVEGNAKGFATGPHLLVQRINGRATQEHIELLLVDETHAAKPDALTNVKPEIGKTYELEGYESGGFVGDPDLGERWRQSPLHHFLLNFGYVRGKQIAAIDFTPQDFVGQRALLQGTARDQDGKAVMDGSAWQVIVNSNAPWPKGIAGKKVETLGMYNGPKREASDSRTSPVFSLIDGTARPVALEDQLGEKVELRGMATSLNGVWWFEFRDIDMYVENLENLPGFSEDHRAKPIVVRGVLDRAKLPRLDQVSVKADRNLRNYFIIRQATWAPTSALLAPEHPSLQRWIATDSLNDKDE